MFNFFKVIRLNKDIVFNSEIISHCNNSTYKVFCNKNNEVKIYWRDWECLTLHTKNVKLCCITDNADYVILLSQGATTGKLLVNIYHISAEFGRKIATLVSNCVLDCTNNVTALSALVCDAQLFLAIGIDNGSIYFYKSSLHKEIPVNAFKYYNVSTKAVKGIKFSKNKENVVMFVCSDAGIFRYTLINNSKLSESKIVLDDKESCINCFTLKQPFEANGEAYLVVAREDAIYCYTPDGRGPCYAINGPKQTVECLGRLFVIVLKPKTCTPLRKATSQIIIYDTDNKIIVMNKELDEVECILPISEHSNCLILLKNGKIFTLRERELRYKLSRLIKKKLYDVALKMLEETKVKFDISNILVQYADYLLQRGDLSAAVNVFSKTIGITSPFIIIKRLFDFRYNEFLINYLSKLVQTTFKLPEHLKLLNYCVRRINLPRNALCVFDIQDNQFKRLYIECITKNENENGMLAINDSKRNKYIFPNSFENYSTTETKMFLSEYGYYLVKGYPNKSEEFNKYTLAECFSQKHTFNQILLPLALMNKQCTLHFIDNLIENCEEDSTYNIIAELILQLWQGGHVDINFVLEFFKSHHSKMYIDNNFVLCRHYKFWPAIKMIYDKYRMEILSTHYLTKCYEIFPKYVNFHTEEYSSIKLSQVSQILKKENLANNYASKYVTYIVKNVINSNPYYILNALSAISASRIFLVSQFNEFITQGQFISSFKCDDLYNNVASLENRVISMEEAMNNYLRRPIEFRSRSCDICKQLIKPPSIYFLCQHSFHKECILQLSEQMVCVVCSNNRYSVQLKGNSTEYGNMISSGNKHSIVGELSKQWNNNFSNLW